MKYFADYVAIKKIMIDKGIKTISELAAKSKINRNTLGKVLNGELQPSADVMYKLVSCLEISPIDAGVIFFNYNLRKA